MKTLFLLILMQVLAWTICSAGIELRVVSSSSVVKVGEAIDWTIALNNTGAEDKSSVELSFIVPQFIGVPSGFGGGVGIPKDSIYPLPSSSAPQLFLPGTTVTWSIGTLPAGQLRLYSIHSRAIAGVIGDTIVFSAAVYGSGALLSDAQSTTVIDDAVQFRCELAANQMVRQLQPGVRSDFSLSFGHAGPTNGYNCIVDAFQIGNNYVDASPGYVELPGRLSWLVGDLKVGDAGIERFAVVPSIPAVIPATNVVGGRIGDGQNSAESTSLLIYSETLGLELQSNQPNEVSAGQLFSASALLRNNSNFDQTNLTIVLIAPDHTGTPTGFSQGKGIRYDLVSPAAGALPAGGAHYGYGKAIYWNVPLLAKGEAWSATVSTQLYAYAMGGAVRWFWRVLKSDRCVAASRTTTMLRNSTVSARPPGAPSILSPVDGAVGVGLSPAIQGSAYADADGNAHLSSQWIVREQGAGALTYDSGETTGSLQVLPGGAFTLKDDTTYQVQVRYRDSTRYWSDYSAPSVFTTSRPKAPAPFQAEIVQGSGASSIRFPTVSGKAYLVEYSDDVRAGSWSLLAGGLLIGDGSSRELLDRTANPPKSRFYRVTVSD